MSVKQRIAFTLSLVALSIYLFGVHDTSATENQLAAPILVQGSALSPSQATVEIDNPMAQTSTLDLFSTGNPDYPLRIIDFNPAWNAPSLQSYFNNAGAFYTQAWEVISGQRSTPNDPLSPVRNPTNDSFMFGVWGDVPGPAVVLRPAALNPPGPALATMDGNGNYRLAISADGSLRFAGTNQTSNTQPLGFGSPFTAVNFDTDLYREGPAWLMTDGGFSAGGNIVVGGKLTAAAIDVGNLTAVSINNSPETVTLLNHDSIAISRGDVVAIDQTVDSAFVRDAYSGDPKVAGVVAATVNPGASGPVVIHGQALIYVTGVVKRGDVLVSAGDGYSARSLLAGETLQAGAAIGKALMSSSTSGVRISALINIM